MKNIKTYFKILIENFKMPNYQKGKIYKIESAGTGLCYVGSTTQTLSRRLAGHVRDYNNYTKSLFEKRAKGKMKYITSYQIIEKGDYKISLIEDFPCENKQQLCQREGENIKNINCVNKNIAGRTKKEYNEGHKEQFVEYRKKYRENNLDMIKERDKVYYENNKDKIKDYKDNYRQNNKDKIQEYGKNYYETKKDKINAKRREEYEIKRDEINERNRKYHEANKEKIKQKQAEKVTCECGSVVRKSDMARHKKTQKHKLFFDEN